MHYLIDGFIREVIEDHPDRGCLLDSKEEFDFPKRLEAPTQNTMVIAIREEFQLDDNSSVNFNAQNTPGRVDIIVRELKDGTPATADDIEFWKADARRLFYVTYTGYLMRVEPWSFSERVATG